MDKELKDYATKIRVETLMKLKSNREKFISRLDSDSKNYDKAMSAVSMSLLWDLLRIVGISDKAILDMTADEKNGGDVKMVAGEVMIAAYLDTYIEERSK